MTAPGGDGEDDAQPDTVRMPTARPGPSGVFEIVRPRRGFLEPDGTLWPAVDLPVPGEIKGPSTYGRT